MRFLINELAKLLGVTSNTIRRYEKSGFIKPRRDTSNYRWYESHDISKAAMIRLYIKCGFTHDEIRAMLEDSSEVKNICIDKLESIDKQLERLRRLRHWLKDNIQLMNTAEVLKDSYVIMKCPPLYYVLYSSDDTILKEKKRLETINYFMYDTPEVQLINVLSKNKEENRYISAMGWAIKESDVEKFNMADIIENNKYIKYYPCEKCLYGALKIPEKDMYNDRKLNSVRTDYMKNVNAYLDKNNYYIKGDIMEIMVNSFGETVSILVCIPIADTDK